MVIQIKKAVKYGAKLRLALYGPSGSGKTYTALAIARTLSEKRICVIDTERGSASKYAGDPFDFDVIELESFHPNGYIEAIRVVLQAGDYDVLVIDSASHEWEGSRGALELAGRDFTNWATVTPLHNKFIDMMLSADIHVIATMRAKEEYVMEKEEGKAKATVRKVGMEPVQRKNMQYEFDIVGSLGMENTLTIEKTRCSGLKDQAFAAGNERAMVTILKVWLSGDPAPAKEPDIMTVYEAGKAHGIWTKETFYATASALLGMPINQGNYKLLPAAQIRKLQEAVAHEQAKPATEQAQEVA
jgi:hypothetical protein